ncbi:leucine-rich repeat-containing protein 63-like isoform X2 [Hydractinia symbiolongicarpus]|nr:leucine-rich repeat-containing protein 63-like isoform X2 [Hydractinia symbiolongicarpus]
MVHALPSKQNEFVKDNTISDCTHQPVSKNEFMKYNSISVPNEFSSIVAPANSQTLHVLDLNEMESLTEVSPRKPWRKSLLEEQAEENYNLSEECAIPHVCTKDKSISHSSCRSRYNICITNSTNSTFYVSEEGLSQDSKNDIDSRKEILSNILTIEFGQDTVSRLVLNVDETKLYLKGYFLDMFEDVPDQLLATLSSVNLSFNNFMEIPEVLFTAKNLISLNMRNNPIKSISGDIKNLVKIKYMNFSFCCLNELQDCVLNLSELEVLDVSYNCIPRLNKSIKNLVSLKELYLDGNFIRHFPTELLQLSLTSFSCQTNFLHKYFWKESVPPILQSLRDVALTCVCKNHNLDKLPLDIKQKIGECGISPCDYCDQLKPHEGIPVLKPVAEIFGIKNLPLLFHVCSQSCRRSLLLASHLNDMK